MERVRFGEVLSEIVPLTGHDVCEILEQQAGSRRPFGQIALSWGLCRPEHVWEAWRRQVTGQTPHVDLRQFGVDAQAAARLPGGLAVRLGVLPVRSTPGHLVIAATEESLPRAAKLLPGRVAPELSFVLADARQLDEGVRRYYPIDYALHEASRSRRCAGGTASEFRCGERGRCAARCRLRPAG